MRTGNINVQAVIAQAQAKLADSPQKTTSSDGASTTEQIGKLYPALAGAHQRIAAQSQTASASLSALGQFKSDLFKLGTVATALTSLSADNTPQAIQSGLEQLVATYNASLKSGGAMATADAAAGAGAGISSAQRELRAASAELDKMGVVRKQDGSLSLDTAALAKALANDQNAVVASLNKMAQSMSGTAAKTLADDSRLSQSLTRLDSRAQALKAQQAAVMRTATQLAELGNASTNTSNSWNAMALAAYRSA